MLYDHCTIPPELRGELTPWDCASQVEEAPTEWYFSDVEGHEDVAVGEEDFNRTLRLYLAAGVAFQFTNSTES